MKITSGKSVPRMLLIGAVSQAAMMTLVHAAPLLTMKEAMNVVVMTESASITLESLKYLDYFASTPELDFAGTYDENGFSSQTTGVIDGAAYSQTYTGVLTGSYGSDISIALTSSGYLGAKTFSTSGTVLWVFDSTASDYKEFRYTENGQINPVWIPILVAFGVGVASGVAANYVYDWLTSGKVESPGKPDKPAGQTITINGSGNTINKTSDASRFNSTFGDGGVTGQVSAVPEPSALALLLAGLGVVAWSGTRRHNRALSAAATA